MELIIDVSQRLSINMVLHRHVCIVSMPNQSIAISNLVLFESRIGNFLRHCYLLGGKKYNSHVTASDQIYE
jgi:hypothetical protein